MTSIRLIGGPSAGEVHRVDDDQHGLSVHKRMTMPVAPRLSLAASTSTTTVTYYTRRRVCSSHGDIVFFAPEGMSDFEPGTRLDELMSKTYRRTFGE